MLKFPTLSPNQDPVLRKLDRAIGSVIVIVFVIVTSLVCCSCGSTKVVTQTVERVSKDTIYLSNVQYDSIYIYQDHVSEHHIGTLKPFETSETFETWSSQPTRTDTLFIKDKSIEYRYKLLKDTIRVVERDSIPYEVTIVETKEIQRPLTWYDHLSRAILWLNIGFVLLVVIRLIRKIKRP